MSCVYVLADLSTASVTTPHVHITERDYDGCEGATGPVFHEVFAVSLCHVMTCVVMIDLDVASGISIMQVSWEIRQSWKDRL